MASPASAIVFGPTDLGFTVSMPGPLSALTKNTIALYAEAIGRAVNAEDDDSHLDELKVCQAIHQLWRAFTNVCRRI